MEQIDIFYIINLKKRTDRLEQIVGELDKMEIPHKKIIRIEAIEDKIGVLGCSKSHALAVEHFISTGKNRCMIFEDDFEFTESRLKVSEVLWGIFNSIFHSKIAIDCLMLSGVSNCVSPIGDNNTVASKVYYASSPSCYIITKEYAPCLLNNLKEGAAKQEKWINAFGEPENIFNLDLYWVFEQMNNNYYMTEPKLGRQRDSPSDIKGTSQNTIILLRKN